MHDITSAQSWSKLKKLHAEKTRTTLRDLFTADERRAERYTFDAAGLHVDLSKNLVDQDVVDTLLALADDASLRDALAECLWSGRAALPVEGGGIVTLNALRAKARPR